MELPQAAQNQYWHVLKVTTEKQILAYPKSNLRLLMGLLHRMEESFKGKDEKYSAYSPIKIPEEVEKFGMARTLQTHVFVGPFMVTPGEETATLPNDSRHRPEKKEEEQMSGQQTPPEQKQAREIIRPPTKPKYI